jgi:hypothetical protein
MKQLSQRQKIFVRLIHEQIPLYRAYALACYRPHDSNPYRMSENYRIKRYLSRLEARPGKSNHITVDSLLVEQRRLASMPEGRSNPPSRSQESLAIGRGRKVPQIIPSNRQG